MVVSLGSLGMYDWLQCFNWVNCIVVFFTRFEPTAARKEARTAPLFCAILSLWPCRLVLYTLRSTSLLWYGKKRIKLDADRKVSWSCLISFLTSSDLNFSRQKNGATPSSDVLSIFRFVLIVRKRSSHLSLDRSIVLFTAWEHPSWVLEVEVVDPDIS